VFVRFVDIGGNVDHHCLNFLFITLTHIYMTAHVPGLVQALQ